MVVINYLRRYFFEVQQRWTPPSAGNESVPFGTKEDLLVEVVRGRAGDQGRHNNELRIYDGYHPSGR